jgi:hypothetical protein
MSDATSSIEFNQLVLDYLRVGRPGAWIESAVVRERGVTYVQYDAIRIGNATDSEGGISIQFLWQSAAVAWTRTLGRISDSVYHTTRGKVLGRLQV